MGTSVHLPPKLVAALERKAAAVGASRNKVVVLALEAYLRDELHPQEPWPIACVDFASPEEVRRIREVFGGGA